MHEKRRDTRETNDRRATVLSARNTTAAATAPANESAPRFVASLSFPDIVEQARRDSTRMVLRQVLRCLVRDPSRTAIVNTQAIALYVGVHRRTVARALDFGIRNHVIEKVAWESPITSLAGTRPGRPFRYKSLWKPTTAKRAPLPHTPSQRESHISYGDSRELTLAFRRAAMATVRARLEDAGASRLSGAFGSYIFATTSTRQGIRVVARECVALLPGNWANGPPRKVYGATRARIRQRAAGHDAAQHIVEEFEDYVPLKGLVAELRKKQLANVANSVYTLTQRYSQTVTRPGFGVTDGGNPDLESRMGDDQTDRGSSHREARGRHDQISDAVPPLRGGRSTTAAATNQRLTAQDEVDLLSPDWRSAVTRARMTSRAGPGFARRQQRRAPTNRSRRPQQTTTREGIADVMRKLTPSERIRDE